MKQQLDDVTTIDFGAHYYPPDLYDGPVSAEESFAGSDRMYDPQTQIEEMRAAGVDALVVSTTSEMGIDDADRAQRANDDLLDVVEQHDEFYGLASLPTAAGGEAAAAEFERCLEAGFHGVALDETEVALTDDEIEPVLDVADRTGAPIFVHIPKLPDVDLRMNAIFGRERAHQESISAVIHRGIFDRYDDLAIVWHHLGGNIASMLGRVHLHTDPDRWPNQGNMKSFEEFKRQLEERVYIDTSGFFGWTAPIRIALEEFPSTQVLFGTDYPWEPRSSEEVEALVDAVLASGTRADARNILGQNALDLLVNT